MSNNRNFCLAEILKFRLPKMGSGPEPFARVALQNCLTEQFINVSCMECTRCFLLGVGVWKNIRLFIKNATFRLIFSRNTSSGVAVFDWSRSDP